MEEKETPLDLPQLPKMEINSPPPSHSDDDGDETGADDSNDSDGEEEVGGVRAGTGGGGGAPPLKKGPWTPDEDKRLRAYVEAHGQGNWNQVQRNAKVIPGSDEGIYAWVAANYVLGTLGGDPHKTIGIIELGGASAQLTFVSDEVLPPELSSNFTFGETTYALYSNSFLNFGQVSYLYPLNPLKDGRFLRPSLPSVPAPIRPTPKPQTPSPTTTTTHYRRLLQPPCPRSVRAPPPAPRPRPRRPPLRLGRRRRPRGVDYTQL